MATETEKSKSYFDQIKPWLKFGAGLLFNCNPISTPALIDICGDVAYKGEEGYGYTREKAARKNTITTNKNFTNGKAKPETAQWTSTKSIIATTALAGASFVAANQSFTAGCLFGLAIVAAKTANDSGALGFMSKDTSSITPTGERIPHKTKQFSSGLLAASLKQNAIGIATTGAGTLLHEPFMKAVKIGLDYIY